MVNESLRRHFGLIKELVARGTYFFDYGNSFMKAIYDAGVQENIQERCRRERRLHLAFLCGGHHGARTL